MFFLNSYKLLVRVEILLKSRPINYNYLLNKNKLRRFDRLILRVFSSMSNWAPTPILDWLKMLLGRRETLNTVNNFLQIELNEVRWKLKFIFRLVNSSPRKFSKLFISFVIELLLSFSMGCLHNFLIMKVRNPLFLTPSFLDLSPKLEKMEPLELGSATWCPRENFKVPAFKYLNSKN